MSVSKRKVKLNSELQRARSLTPLEIGRVFVCDRKHPHYRDGRVRYVGKSHRTASRRLRRHLAPCYLTGETHKERWIRQLLALGLEPSIEVLQCCETSDDLACAEREHIARLRAEGADLTNVTDGGDGACGWRHTDESRQKISVALTGKPKSEVHRLRSAAASRGRKPSAATLAKLSAVRRGRFPAPRYGSENNKTKLTTVIVAEIRQLRGVVSQRQLAARFGVSKTAVRYVQQGRNWKESDLRVREFPQ